RGTPPLACRPSPPQGGRLGGREDFDQPSNIAGDAIHRCLLISPLEGEMPGRPEGGATGRRTDPGAPYMFAARLKPSSVGPSADCGLSIAPARKPGRTVRIDEKRPSVSPSSAQACRSPNSSCRTGTGTGVGTAPRTRGTGGET